jgi:alkylation response protein AidB-like acyl-CoA dehydrogenase
MAEPPLGAGSDPVAAPDRTGWVLQGRAAWSTGSLAAILVTTVTAAALSAADASGPIRPAVTVLFLLACPGLSLVRLLGLRDPIAELALGVATSVAVAGVVAGIQLYSGMWSPLGGLAILVAITAIGLATQWLVARRRSPQER